MPIAALSSEAAYEGWRDDVNDWGESLAGTLDRACWWMLDAGIRLDCRKRD